MPAVAERFVFIAMGLFALSISIPIAASLFSAQAPSFSFPSPPENPFGYTGNPFAGLPFGDWIWAAAKTAEWLGSTPSIVSNALAAVGVGEPWVTVFRSLVLASMFFFALMIIARVFV